MLHVNNHVSSLYSPSTTSLEWPLRLCREQRLAADIRQILRYDLLFCPSCRWQAPSQSRAPWVSAGLHQAPSFGLFPAEGLLCFSLRSLRLVAASGSPQWQKSRGKMGPGKHDPFPVTVSHFLKSMAPGFPDLEVPPTSLIITNGPLLIKLPNPIILFILDQFILQVSSASCVDE